MSRYEQEVIETCPCGAKFEQSWFTTALSETPAGLISWREQHALCRAAWARKTSFMLAPGEEISEVPPPRPKRADVLINADVVNKIARKTHIDGSVLNVRDEIVALLAELGANSAAAAYLAAVRAAVFRTDAKKIDRIALALVRDLGGPPQVYNLISVLDEAGAVESPSNPDSTTTKGDDDA